MAFTFAACHHPFSWRSPFTRSTSVRRRRLPRTGTLIRICSTASAGVSRVSIHSLSAAAIEDVIITDGETRPIGIEILMNNSSGIYQVDGLLKAKLLGSGLEPYVEVTAHIDTEAEKRLVPIYKLET